MVLGRPRVSPFGLRGGNTVKKDSLAPPGDTTDLTRRGNSNVLATFSIIQVLMVT